MIYTNAFVRRYFKASETSKNQASKNEGHVFNETTIIKIPQHFERAVHLLKTHNTTNR